MEEAFSDEGTIWDTGYRLSEVAALVEGLRSAARTWIEAVGEMLQEDNGGGDAGGILFRQGYACASVVASLKRSFAHLECLFGGERWPAEMARALVFEPLNEDFALDRLQLLHRLTEALERFEATQAGLSARIADYAADHDIDGFGISDSDIHGWLDGV